MPDAAPGAGDAHAPAAVAAVEQRLDGAAQHDPELAVDLERRAARRAEDRQPRARALDLVGREALEEERPGEVVGARVVDRERLDQRLAVAADGQQPAVGLPLLQALGQQLVDGAQPSERRLADAAHDGVGDRAGLQVQQLERLGAQRQALAVLECARGRDAASAGEQRQLPHHLARPDLAQLELLPARRLPDAGEAAGGDEQQPVARLALAQHHLARLRLPRSRQRRQLLELLAVEPLEQRAARQLRLCVVSQDTAPCSRRPAATATVRRLTAPPRAGRCRARLHRRPAARRASCTRASGARWSCRA